MLKYKLPANQVTARMLNIPRQRAAKRPVVPPGSPRRKRWSLQKRAAEFHFCIFVPVWFKFPLYQTQPAFWDVNAGIYAVWLK